MPVKELLNKSFEVLTSLSLVGSLVYLRSAKLNITKEIDTACITLEPQGFVISVNPDFIEEHANTPTKMATVLLHELFHQLFSHKRYPCTSVWNIATDAYINAALYHLNKRTAKFFMDFYRPDQLPEAILRKGSNVPEGTLNIIYKRLYSAQFFKSVTVTDIVQALTSTGGDFTQVAVIGTHQPIDVQPYILASISKDMQGLLGQNAALSGSYFQEILNVNKSNIINHLVYQVLVSDIQGEIISAMGKNNEDVSVVNAGLLGRRDAVYFGIGLLPVFYTASSEELASAHIYIDVSGSVFDELPFIIGLIQSMEEYFNLNLYQFSTEVYPLTQRDLRQKKINTTGGTSFNCIAKHLKTNLVEKAMIITDGHANIRKDLLQDLTCDLIGVLTTPNQNSVLHKMCKTVYQIPQGGRSNVI